MFRSLAMFPKTPGSRFDMDYFLNKHLPLVKTLFKHTGLISIDVEIGVALAPPHPALGYTVITALTFNTLEALEQATASNSARLRADIPNFTNVQPLIQVNQLVSGFHKAPEAHKEGVGR